MTCSTSLSGKNRIVLIAGILMIATTLRVTFTGAAPLLDTIRSAYSLTTAQTGLLTTLPFIGLCANLTSGCPGGSTFWYGT